MPANDIAILVGHPERLNRSTLYTLRAVVARYPWFETARLLLLNNLYLLHDPEFGEALRASVFYVHDRRTLYRLIDTLSHPTEDTPENDAYADVEPEPSVDRTMSLIEDFLSTLPEMPQTLLPDMPVSTDYMAMMAKSEDEDPQMETDALDDLISLLPSSAEAKQGETKVSDLPITASSAALHEALGEQADASSEESINPEYFTETLARIYIRQKKYERALEIIRSLYLNNPEKNAYFADQIRFLEKLVENNNLKK